MILEVAPLDVRPGLEGDFERAFAQAREVIAASPGFVGLELQRSVRRPGRYLLLVRWRTLEDHTVGFRQGPLYPRWKALLHHFYDPFPVVEHFRPV
ncbi:antibiotic biosynthesis monooxygenase family protein [Saccharothrix coeruleofusca]|uniref:Antibiotic biosynthesis monooxygenase n=1 Tax=Saccharothrix coeruleofusca TaxID=33919 RepID=A0A918AVR9_9PSEU|nr:antibiotic biosynthesis monooxygenase [Saccharothrix coeruleofusca]GGP83913.1 antibiotic biosynthesis monooxygenase [Saccharothrix coeruleofusca]